MHAIDLKGLSKKYANGPWALKNVNLEVQEGDFFALLGANGAGKTTIIGILTGLINKTEGKVKVFGHNIDSDHDEAKKLIGVVPQEFNFNIFEKVIDIVCTQAGYFGINRTKALARAEKILKQLNLWDKRQAKAMELSGGMKRRLMIARALINQPKLLLLDEPTAGVDVELRYDTWEYIKNLNSSGTTIVLTTHYLEEVEQLCKNVAMIKEGEIIKNDSVKNMLNSLENQTYVLTVNSVKDWQKLKDYKIEKVDENTLEVNLSVKDGFGVLVKKFADHSIDIIDARPKNNRMDQLFLDLLRKEN